MSEAMETEEVERRKREAASKEATGAYDAQQMASGGGGGGGQASKAPDITEAELALYRSFPRKPNNNID